MYKRQPSDSDYQSVDFEFFRTPDDPISPIKDEEQGKMEQEKMEMEGHSAKRPRTNPLEGANAISKLAKVYDRRVQETRSAKGLEATVREDDNCEVTFIGSTVGAPKAQAKVKNDYRQAPTLTLNELLLAGFQPQKGEGTASKLHNSFGTDKVEFVLMCRKLVATERGELEWDLPDQETFDEIVMTASAAFIGDEAARSDALLWSSIGQNTGVGMFAMSTSNMDWIEQFRLLLRRAVHEDLEFESFPKESLLESYALTIYAHRGTRPFRPTTMVEILRRGYP